MSGNPIVFGTRTYAWLQREIALRAGASLGEIERKEFPDGERYHCIATSVEGRDAVLVGGTISDRDTLELYDLACGLVQEDARSLTLIIPFFGYGTMERVSRPGEVVTAKNRARLLSSIPVPGSGAKVLLLDMHSEGVPFYFEGSLRPVHLRATELVLAVARRTAGEDFVLACTDAGRAKWVESLANRAGVPASFVFKRRKEDGSTEVIASSAAVQGKRVVVYDDLIRTGSSLIGAARAYLDAGAREVSAIATHGLLPGDALEKLRSSGLFSGITCTDSHPRARELACDFLKVESVAEIFAAYLRTA